MEAETESPRMMACCGSGGLAQLQRVDQKKIGARSQLLERLQPSRAAWR